MKEDERRLLEEIHRRLLEDTSDDEKVADGAFERRMNGFVIIANLATALATYLAYQYMMQLFAVCFGLFFVFLILAVGLVIDEYLLPVDTFRRISTNAIAIAIFWAAIVFLAVSGVRIGTTIISDPFAGEEAQGITASRATRGDQVERGLYDSGKASTSSTTASIPAPRVPDDAQQEGQGEAAREQ